MALLEIKDLVTTFDVGNGNLVTAVDGVSFNVEKGKTLGIVGESGSGKSVTSLSIMRLLPKPMGQSTGQVLLDGENILDLPAKQMLKIRGKKIAMIFQEPMTALNPVHTVGQQLMETVQVHFPKLSKKERLAKAVDMLTKVGIPAPEKRVHEYPHQLSGGMRQRVMIAMALTCEPDVLIADEPTTALDVTIQAQILDLMRDLQKKNGMAIVFITHDLGVVAEMCDDVLVMYAGRPVEFGTAKQVFHTPKHPYSYALLKSTPRMDDARQEKLYTIEGIVPSLAEMPDGCRFGPRSEFEHEQSSYDKRPIFHDIGDNHWIEDCPCCQKGLKARLAKQGA